MQTQTKKQLTVTFNGTKSQAKALTESIKVEIAKKERAERMRKWFIKK